LSIVDQEGEETGRWQARALPWSGRDEHPPSRRRGENIGSTSAGYGEAQRELVDTADRRPQQIAVPETLLKKRRTTEASREAKLAAAAKARQVSEISVACTTTCWRLGLSERRKF
jgi:adenylosuccinate synthase